MLSDRIQESENNPIGDFSILPDEVIVAILEELEGKDIESIARTSSFFFETCKHFFSLHGRSLRFSKWQEQTLDELKSDVESFKDKYSITLLSPAHRTLGENIQNYTTLFHSIILAISAVNKLYDFIRSEGNTKNNAKLTQAFQEASDAYTNITTAMTDTNNLNTQFQQSPATQQHLIKLERFLIEKKLFLSDHVRQLDGKSVSIDQLLKFLQQELESVVALSAHLNEYLQTSKMTSQKFLNANDFQRLEEIHPALPLYTKNIACLWQQNNKRHESLIDMKPSSLINNTY